MTPHVCLRMLSVLVLFFVTVLLLLCVTFLRVAPPVDAQAVAAPSASPVAAPLVERLDRLAAEFDRTASTCTCRALCSRSCATKK